MVYIDSANIKYGRMKMCHMLADSPEELHSMADKLGLDQKWFQAKASTPHYDVCLSKKQLALDLGAKEVTMRELAKLLPTIRKAFK